MEFPLLIDGILRGVKKSGKFIGIGEFVVAASTSKVSLFKRKLYQISNLVNIEKYILFENINFIILPKFL